MAEQPTGTVTMLFSDIEGSTRLLDRLGVVRYTEVREQHNRLLREAFARHAGYEVDTAGDSFFVSFGRAADAVAAARDAQRALGASTWPERTSLRVRMALHTGEPLIVGSGYVGMDVHRAARVMAAAHGGQVLVTESTASLLDGAPLVDLGLHRLKDLLAPIRLYQLLLDGQLNEFPAPRSLYRTNLPIAAWPLVGRESELDQVRTVITSDRVRLVTLTGPGGSGKTRLALQATAELSDDFPDGAYFVPLAPLRDVARVPAVVAEAIGLRPDDDVVGALRSKRLLLLLDNLEHLDGIASVVSDLLVGESTVVATSRTPLRLIAEREFAVPPLADDAAVELFVSRAAAAGREVAADDVVGAVCRRLDNLPLALELAAARAKLLSPSVLLQRLDSALPLLTGGRSDRPERQRTLRATIEWSNDLLDPESQVAFRRLSVFRGSFTLGAAESIAGADLDQIEALLDQSLLKTIGDERFFLLETIRDYTREQLDEAGETDEYRNRHTDWYADQLSAVQSQRATERFEWVVAEQDNLNAMLDRLAATDPERAHVAMMDMWGFHRARGLYQEWWDRTTALLADPRLSEDARRTLVVWKARTALLMGDPDVTQRAVAEALAATEGIGGEDAILALLAAASVWRNGEEGVRYATEARELSAGLSDDIRYSVVNDVAIALAEAGRVDEARELTYEARDGFERIQSEIGMAVAADNLGWFALATGDFEAARSSFEGSQQAARRIGHPAIEASGARGLGLALLALGRRDQAHESFQHMFELVTELASDRPMELDAAAGIALTAASSRARERARLRGAISRLRQSVKRDWDLGSDRVESQLEQHLIENLGRDEWEHERVAGARLSFDEAIALARELAEA